MINKQGLIFLTLTSLILVLSIYYVLMPSELLLTTNSSYLNNEQDKTEPIKVSMSNDNTFTAMKSILNSSYEEELANLKKKLTNKELGVEEKNNIYEEIQSINKIKTMEEKIENILKDEFNLESFIKISNDVIEVTVNKEENDLNLAVKIMSRIEKEYNNMYISVSFKK